MRADKVGGLRRAGIQVVIVGKAREHSGDGGDGGAIAKCAFGGPGEVVTLSLVEETYQVHSFS